LLRAQGRDREMRSLPRRRPGAATSAVRKSCWKSRKKQGADAGGRQATSGQYGNVRIPQACAPQPWRRDKAFIAALRMGEYMFSCML